MGLTEFLKEKDHKPFRDKFNEEFLKPKFDVKLELKAPPLTANYSSVGGAFDYLLRFFMEHINKEKFEHRRYWNAENALKELQEIKFPNAGKKFFLGKNQKISYPTKILESLIHDKFTQCRFDYEDYIQTGEITDDILSDVLFLSNLDIYLRTGILYPTTIDPVEDDIKDLRNIYNLLDKSIFQAKSMSYLNPRFGVSSAMITAEADLIIDDSIIDIKVTKNPELSRDYFNQLIGYYLLSCIGGVNSNPDNNQLKNLGIYFARQGCLWTVPVDSIGSEEKIEMMKLFIFEYTKPSNKTLEEWKSEIRVLNEFNKNNPVKQRSFYIDEIVQDMFEKTESGKKKKANS